LAPLEHFLLSADIEFIYALYNSTEISKRDELSKSIVISYLESGEALKLILDSIEREIRICTNEQTLFRENSPASGMMSAFAKIYGMAYLYDTIGQSIFDICFATATKQVDMEVDPSRLAQKVDEMESGFNVNDVQVNQWQFLTYAQKLLNSITKDPKALPEEMRVICNNLQQSVLEKGWYTSRYSAVGGFVFLRFIVPSIIRPETFGLGKFLKEQRVDDTTARRNLILVAKALQNLSNGTVFNEPHMANVNVFIEQNKNSIHTYFDEIAKSFPYIAPEESKWPKAPKDIRHQSLGVIHKNLVANIESVDSQLQETSPATAKGLKIFVQGALYQIGEPVDYASVAGGSQSPAVDTTKLIKGKKDEVRF